MKRSIAIVAGLIFGPGIFGLSACPKPEVKDPSPSVVAAVDGDPIYAGELQRVLASYDSARADGESQVALAKALLDDLILERILLNEAQQKKIKVSPEEIGEALEQTVQGYRARDFQNLLHKVYLTPTMLNARIKRDLSIEHLLLAEVDATPIDLNEAALRDYFNKHRDRFELPEQVRARQILVRTREEAEQLKLRARKEPFEDLARRYSVAPEASKGGDLGFFGRGTMPPVFDLACFSLQAGQISDVVASTYGFHLFQVVEVRPAEHTPFEQARDQIRTDLEREQRQARARAYTQKLRAHAKVQRHLDVLASLVGENRAAESGK